MTVATLIERATRILGRDVRPEFALAVLHGDPFVYEARCREDGEAASIILGLATGRLS